MADPIPVLNQRKKNSTGRKIALGYAVKLSDDAAPAAVDDILLCDGDTDVFYGVVTDADGIRDGDYGYIGVIGTYECVAGGAVTRGWRVGPNADGKFVHATRDGQTVAGVAEQDAAGDDAHFQVTLGVGITLSKPGLRPAGGRPRRRRRRSPRRS